MSSSWYFVPSPPQLSQFSILGSFFSNITSGIKYFHLRFVLVADNRNPFQISLNKRGVCCFFFWFMELGSTDNMGSTEHKDWNWKINVFLYISLFIFLSSNSCMYLWKFFFDLYLSFFLTVSSCKVDFSICQ